MDLISTSLRLPRDLHDRLLGLQADRQRENPRRRVTVTEVAVEVVARGLDALASVVPQMDPPFVAEFGPIPTAFTHRMDAAGQTHRWPDDSPAWQVLWCRGVGPSARRDRVGDGWGEWSVVMPPLPVPEVK